MRGLAGYTRHQARLGPAVIREVATDLELDGATVSDPGSQDAGGGGEGRGRRPQARKGLFGLFR